MLNRLTLIALVLVLCSEVLAGTSICDATECIMIGTLPVGTTSEVDGATRAQFIDGRLYVADKYVADFPAGAKIVIGDWDGDGIDDPGAYANGIWNLQSGWDVTPLQATVDMTAFNPGPDATPLVGSWDGAGIDGIGIYDNGRFTLFSDFNDLSQPTVIDFGPIANNTGTIAESMPFVGPVDQVMDRVGLSKVTWIAYAPHNGAATYDFTGQDSNLVFGNLSFRGWMAFGYVRPYVLDGSLIEDLQSSQYIVAFRYPPGMESPANQCAPSGGYECYDSGSAEPRGSGSVVIPFINPLN